MSIIFITGLSGVGKSSVLKRLERDGYAVVDTDYGYTTIETDGSAERVLDEEKINELLERHQGTDLFLSGCYSNQGKFYKHFDHVVLLKAELNIMMDRLDRRTSNHYGKSADERNEVIHSYENVLPLLVKGSDVVLDTSHIGIERITEKLKGLL
ncbi:AAA family ATPase [Halobacillus litoralis]|uniref:AAA family ATPase n=1 Tax=Halobacillus litoralis TaxID=45668 RepID=UPI001CD1A0B1|nr:AAA family ATPase [Halobacillus litoralis]MCA0970807.1 AAA family ATPase [Halobacillus litoralis]